ncbi:MAG: T9SS type A sorting domain-containing protein [Aureispira sp.]|nr:T9SS type A sorting domain-containing protein [Aureispira sp.]
MKKLLFTLSIIATTVAAQAQIVINEIMYNTPETSGGSGDTEEFVELLNTTANPINLQGYTIKDNASPITFGNISIPANGFLIVAKDSTDFNTAFGFYPHAESNMTLSNGGDYVVLKDASGTVIDSVRYDDVAPWADEADGDGNSLQLCDAANDNNNGANWGISQDSAGTDVQDPTKTIYATPNAANNCVAVVAPPYPLYTISGVNSSNSTTGVADSLNATCELRGIVHCVDFDNDAGGGYQVRMVETTTKNGITVYSPIDLGSYTAPASGDSIHVKGKIVQFNGLLEIEADSASLISTGNSTVSAVIFTTLGEYTENQYVTLKNMFVVDTSNWNTGVGTGFTVRITNGTTDTFDMRVDDAISLFNRAAPAPTDTFSVTGFGSQSDNSSPYTEGYSIWPCGDLAFNNPSVSVQKVFTAKNILKVYPNPTYGVLNVEASETIDHVMINNMLGQEVMRLENANSTQLQINTNDLENGVYTITLMSGATISTKQFQVLR